VKNRRDFGSVRTEFLRNGLADLMESGRPDARAEVLTGHSKLEVTTKLVLRSFRGGAHVRGTKNRREMQSFRLHGQVAQKRFEAISMKMTIFRLK